METITDCHVHLASLFPPEELVKLHGKEKLKKYISKITPKYILNGMDKNKVDKIILFSGTSIDKIDYVRKETDHLAKIASAGKKRIFPFLRINPVMPGAADEIKRAVNDYKFCGIKILPNEWYPYEDKVLEIYKVINELKVPILAHSGILWGHGASSMYCRPVFYECLMNYPNIKFALAHVGWPWTDECLALAGRFATGDVRRKQMFLDITTGAPRIWKLDVMRKTLSYIPHDTIIYGSDSAPWADGYRDWVKTDFEILHDLGADKKTVKMIMHDNFYDFLK